MTPRDRVGIAAFSDDAQELLSLRSVTEDAKRELHAAIHSLEARHHTNMEAGLRLGMEMIPPHRANERQLLLLLSDGVPNLGLCTPLTLGEVSRTARGRASIWTLGYGPHHQEDILTAVSNAAGGRYEYIPKPQVSEFVFGRVLGAQGLIVADAVELLIRPAPGFDVTRLVGKPEVRYGADGLSMPLPDFFVGSRKPVVAELAFTAPKLAGHWAALETRLRFRETDTGRTSTVENLLQVMISDEEPVPNDDARADVLLARADEARSEARNMADRGQFEGARVVLAEMVREIERSPGFTAFDGSPLSEACEELRDEMMAMELKPRAEDYKAFRRSQMSISVSQQGYTSTSINDENVYGREIMRAVAGEYPRARLEQLNGIEGGRMIPLRPEQIIGRAQGVDIVVLSPQVTRHHTRIMAQRGKFYVMDLGSANGTWLNDSRIDSHILAPGDVITVAEIRFRYDELVDNVEPRLLAIGGDGSIFVVEKDRLFVIGRSRACTMVIDSETVGRQHAAVRFREGKYWFEDYGSEHGSIGPSGGRLTERVVIGDGDQFVLGGHLVKFVFRN
jgi:Ca-activated chloride channel family protein